MSELIKREVRVTPLTPLDGQPRDAWPVRGAPKVMTYGAYLQLDTEEMATSRVEWVQNDHNDSNTAESGETP